jgi:hypothetical protein
MVTLGLILDRNDFTTVALKARQPKWEERIIIEPRSHSARARPRTSHHAIQLDEKNSYFMIPIFVSIISLWRPTATTLRYLLMTEWTSFKELDEAQQHAKGESFKRFKAIEAELTEGTDYLWLSAIEHGEQIADLKQQGLVYSTSINVVLVSAATASRLSPLK